MAFTGNIFDIFYQLENLGFFDIVLPFLLAFAVVYGILTYMKIFGTDKAVHVIIAVVIGLLAIRFPFYSAFLSEISPRLGVGLTVLLTALILLGLFAQTKGRSAILWILFALGGIIFLVILVQTGSVLGFIGAGYFSQEAIGWLVMVAVLIGIIVAVVSSKGETPGDSHPVGLFASGAGKPPSG